MLMIKALRVICLGLSLALFCCNWCQSAQPEVVRFGVCLSMSGEFKNYGSINLAGINLFLDDYNKRSAATGVRLEMVLRDDKSDPATAADIVRELATRENIQVIIGPITSGIMFAMIEEAKKHNVVLISPAATNPGIGAKGDWAFKVLLGDDYQGAALARFFRAQMGATTAAAVINEQYDYGELIFQAFRKTFEGLGGRIVAEERFSWNLAETAPDFAPLLKRIKAAKPEMTLLPGYAEEGVEIVRQSAVAGLDTVFCGGDAWLNQRVMFEAGEKLDDSYYIGGAEVYSSTPQARQFVQLLEQSSNPLAEPSSVNGYDCMLLLAEAIRAGARAAPQIRDRLYRLRGFPLAAGNISFDETAGTGKTLYVYRIAKMDGGFYGEVVYVVEPE